ncbi:MAG: hypothetical protein HY564_02195 [Candidatus Jacksonbacteria bacterium]|nr:hypothetical protein [Candidatus Jacksonbacteria bacterium]
MMDFEEIKKKIEELKRSGTVDLSTDEDLSIAVMNLISLEEHFFFTAQKTGKEDYLNLLHQAREMRKKLLARLIPANEGETWCVSKHLLAATMRLMEVGTKLHSDKKKDEAREVFSKAGELFSLFWGLRLKLIDVSDLKEQAASERPWTLKDIMDKLVNCCDE